MLRDVDLDRALKRRVFAEDLPALRRRLAELHWHAAQASIPSLVVFEGLDGSGKGESIRLLTERLDARGFKVHPIGPPAREDGGRPWLQRFWQRIPRRGVLAIFDRSWYGRLLGERIERVVARTEWERGPRDIQAFERALVDDGALLVKLWLHIGKKEQRRRLRALERDPVERFRIAKGVWRRHARYDDWVDAADEMIELTSSARAPWTVIEANDPHFAWRKMYDVLISAFEERLAAERARAAPRARRARAAPHAAAGGDALAERRESRRTARLADVDLSVALARARYEKLLAKQQARLLPAVREMQRRGLAVIVALEGWDASGKGGAIRRLTQPLDPRGYEVHAIGAPAGDDRDHHYLWRFWRRLPAAGQLGVFDRTWYGRVLVERVEGFCGREAWSRAYLEIPEFERQLVDAGLVLVKFWMHISPEEQLRRFRERAKDPLKGWKLTPDDWRNRRKWSVYFDAADEMLARTHSTFAPWTIVEADDKYHARVKVLEKTVDAIEKAL